MAESVADVLRALVTGDRAALHDPEWVKRALHVIGKADKAADAPKPSGGKQA